MFEMDAISVLGTTAKEQVQGTTVMNYIANIYTKIKAHQLFYCQGFSEDLPHHPTHTIPYVPDLAEPGCMGTKFMMIRRWS
jgi:hypothetical protein